MTPRAPFLALCFLVSLSAAAQQLPRNEVSLFAGWTDFADIGGARAAGVAYSHYWTPAVATQVGAFRASDRVTFTDVHATAEYHLYRERFLSPWAGLGIAHVALDEPAASKVTWLAGAGVDVNVSRRLAIGGQFHYSELEIDPRSRFALRVNPATFSVAARWRF